MKFKLNYNQVQALYQFFTELLQQGNKMAFPTMQARLCYSLLHSIYIKLHQHILPAGTVPKAKYSITLDEKEFISFFLFFSQYEVPDTHAYAAFIIQAICNEINQQYV